MRIGGGVKDGKLRFTLSGCGRRKGVFVDALEVETVDPQDVQEIGRFVCVLEAEPLSDKRQIAKDWEYASVPSGWTAKRCEPELAPGLYRIHMHGPGLGTRMFSIGEDGSFKWESETCD